MNIPPEVSNPIVDWARATPDVRRVWIIGDDAGGEPPRDADLDVAIETVPVADSDETVTRWVAKAEDWRDDLQSRLSRRLDLQWFDPNGGTPDVRRALDAGAVLVYDRAQSPSG